MWEIYYQLKNGLLAHNTKENINNNGGFMEQNEFDEKIKYAQNIINILQTRLNESVAQNVQLEATVTVLKEKVEQSKQELIDGDSPKTEEK
jgi:hypothetical protein